jgi:hypothetical protein
LAEEEIWKDIPEHPHYAVSSHGNVKSKRSGKLIKKQLKPARGGKIYEKVHLGTKKQAMVHRLVCITFHGPPPEERMEAAHRNDVGTDNRSNNLRWLTHQQNIDERGKNKANDSPKFCNNCPCLEETHDEIGQCHTVNCPCTGFKRRKIRE